MRSADDLQNEGSHPAERPHWSARPMGLLAAVLLAKLLISLLSLIAIATAPWANAEPTVLFAFGEVVTALTVLAGILLYRRIRVAQARHRAGYAVQWRLGAAFWAGVALALGYGVLANFELARYQPMNAVSAFLNPAAQALVATMFLSLLWPAMEARFGIMRGALVISAAYALLAMVERLALGAASSALMAALTPDVAAPFSWGGTLLSMLRGVVPSVAGTAMGVAAYLLASRRVPGAWLLAFSLGGLFSLLNRAIVNALVEGGAVSARVAGIWIDLPFELLVLALALCVLACFRRWRTLPEFGASLRRLAAKLRTTQDID